MNKAQAKRVARVGLDSPYLVQPGGDTESEVRRVPPTSAGARHLFSCLFFACVFFHIFAPFGGHLGPRIDSGLDFGTPFQR